MNQQLANFYDHLNTAVITTNDFQEGTLFRKREKVSQFAYCGLNVDASIKLSQVSR